MFDVSGFVNEFQTSKAEHSRLIGAPINSLESQQFLGLNQAIQRGV
jgi:hypothetical protein